MNMIASTVRGSTSPRSGAGQLHDAAGQECSDAGSTKRSLLLVILWLILIWCWALWPLRADGDGAAADVSRTEELPGD
jgi:hypothetical protein